ncbi:MAG: hypothetical protein OXE79_10710 [Acidimicrobiaceae bacterium]|nr:hypothetical protein [Acidimicrobiaceae bacterium]MCY4174905.1 hypothetical protein [Acidimicrobiaceae bacterium]MCY4279560.1 hypothetical protein [Acidimicrobiaceae bacterium]MCY4295286.1 hypothetical protein [Acidimicrobiaceae bacterium]
MGTFSCPLRLTNMDSDLSATVDATVDTGAFYTQAPAETLRRIGVRPFDSFIFRLADGRNVRRDVGRAWASVNGAKEVTLVVFGDDEAPALLGAYTLEGLNLAVDPVHQRLLPIETRTL